MNEKLVDHRNFSLVHMSKKGVARLKHVFQSISNNKSNSYSLLSTLLHTRNHAKFMHTISFNMDPPPSLPILLHDPTAAFPQCAATRHTYK